jgi:hypothetical protein
MRKQAVFLALAIIPFCESGVYCQTVFSAAGADAASIQGTLDAFRNSLGTLNGNLPQNFSGGRREINWDAVPDAFSAPNPFPGGFFNGNVPGRARGVVFSTPGTGFMTSATAASGVGIDFTNINPSYDGLFEAFSAERLFTAIDSNVMDVDFFSPADQVTEAATRGFGVVFSGVELPNTSRLDFFDRQGTLLASQFVESFAEPESFSFLGVLFDDPILASVRIFSGTDALGGNQNLNAGVDLVVMDDFVFGEQVIPEPSSVGLITGLLGIGLIRRRRVAR